MSITRTIALLLLLSSPTAAAADYAHCAALHERMPDRVADLDRSDGGAYPEKELGFFDKYRNGRTALVTVFLYDYGMERINAADVRVHFEGALEDMEAVAGQNAAQDWKLLSELSISDSSIFSEGAIASSRSGETTQYDVVLTGMSGHCIVKLRLTAFSDPDGTLDLLGQVVGGVERALDP